MSLILGHQTQFIVKDLGFSAALAVPDG